MEKIINYLSFERLPGQQAELDGLRGLAIILVLLRHAVTPFWSDQQALLPIFGWDAATLMANGWIGVDLFFVLSGFLITRHILKIQATNNGLLSWRLYLTKRALRIVPAYYMVLLLVLAGLFPFYKIPQVLLEFRVLYHTLFLQDYLPANIVVAFWSLGVEEKFYLIAPLLIMMLQKRSSLNLKLLGILGLISAGVVARIFTAQAHPEIDQYNDFFFSFRSPFHLTLDPILIGVLLAFIDQARGEAARLLSPLIVRLIFWLAAVLLILLLTTSVLMANITWWDKTIQPTLIALACGGITFGLIFGTRMPSLFRSTILFFFARISYSLYLIHLPLVPLALVLTKRLAPEHGEFLIFCTIFFTISIMAALLLHYIIEKPFLLIKDRIGAATKSNQVTNRPSPPTDKQLY